MLLSDDQTLLTSHAKSQHERDTKYSLATGVERRTLMSQKAMSKSVHSTSHEPGMNGSLFRGCVVLIR